VALSKSFGNDQIERVAKCLRFGKSKQVLGRGIPEPNYTAGVSDNDGVRERLD
jgi:hypothetical protein